MKKEEIKKHAEDFIRNHFNVTGGRNIYSFDEVVKVLTAYMSTEADKQQEQTNTSSRKFFVKDLSGRGGSSECSFENLIEIYGDQDYTDASREDMENVKSWAESAEVGEVIELCMEATTIECISI